MTNQVLEMSVTEKVENEFKNQTKDGICAYVTLDIPKDLIPDEYLIAGIEEENSSSFTGVIVLKEKLQKYNTDSKHYATLYLETCQKAVNCMFRTNNSWYKKYKIGVLNITTSNN